MGRPEKSNIRKMSPAAQVLFPLSGFGGNTRNLTNASNFKNNSNDVGGKLTLKLGRRFCNSCKKETYKWKCECGNLTIEKPITIPENVQILVKGEIKIKPNGNNGASLIVKGTLFTDKISFTNNSNNNGKIDVCDGFVYITTTNNLSNDNRVKCANLINDEANLDDFLPIELTSFTAQVKNNIVVLNWETASEEKNDYFTIYRSDNGVTFEEIATQNGNGTTTATQYYAHNDENPLNGVAYYRLTQTDYDGTQTHSHIVTVLFVAETASFEVATQTTNHGATSLNISFSENNTANYISVYSLQGAVKYNNTIPAGVLSHTVELALTSGIYIVNNVSKGVKQSTKIVVQ